MSEEPKLLTGEALTWNELVRIYDCHHGGRRARTLPMDEVYEWAAGKPDLFLVDTEGQLYQVEVTP